MPRLFDNILDGMDTAKGTPTAKEEEAIYFRNGNKELSEADINHYAKVYGFDSADYTLKEKRLLAINRINYWTSPCYDEDDPE